MSCIPVVVVTDIFVYSEQHQEYIHNNVLQLNQETCRYLRDSRPIILETEYSVQQKASQRRPISGQTWSVEPSYKQMLLSSVK